MNCEKCGAKLNSPDEVCSCTAEENTLPPPKTDLQEFLEVKEHIAVSQQCKRLGIASLCLSLVFVPALVVAAVVFIFTFGIGSIFSLAVLAAMAISDISAIVCSVILFSKLKRLPETSADKFDFNVQSRYEKAKKTDKISKILAKIGIAFVVSRVIITVLLFIAAVVVLLVAAILFIIGGYQLVANFPFLYNQFLMFLDLFA